MSAHKDITSEGCVARLPDFWRPHVLLARPIGASLLFLPRLWSILAVGLPVWPTLRLVALFAVAAVLMRGAGRVVNDCWDCSQPSPHSAPA